MSVRPLSIDPHWENITTPGAHTLNVMFDFVISMDGINDSAQEQTVAENGWKKNL